VPHINSFIHVGVGYKAVKPYRQSSRVFRFQNVFAFWVVKGGAVRVFKSDNAGNGWYGIVIEIEAQTVT
jgi:hypothetical protein